MNNMSGSVSGFVIVHCGCNAQWRQTIIILLRRLFVLECGSDAVHRERVVARPALPQPAGLACHSAMACTRRFTTDLKSRSPFEVRVLSRFACNPFRPRRPRGIEGRLGRVTAKPHAEPHFTRCLTHAPRCAQRHCHCHCHTRPHSVTLTHRL